MYHIMEKVQIAKFSLNQTTNLYVSTIFACLLRFTVTLMCLQVDCVLRLLLHLRLLSYPKNCASGAVYALRYYTYSFYYGHTYRYLYFFSVIVSKFM